MGEFEKTFDRMVQWVTYLRSGSVPDLGDLLFSVREFFNFGTLENGGVYIS